MNPYTLPFPDDPLGYRTALTEALADPLLAESDVVAARALLFLGRCRVYGVNPHAEFPAERFTAALREFVRLLPGWTESAKTLGDRWYATDDPWEADDLCTALIELRTKLHGVEMVLVDQAVDADEFLVELDRFDQAFAEQLPVLGTLVGGTWLENYRYSVDTELREDPPWWLGSKLEEAARASESDAVATMPSAETWSAYRTAVRWKSVFPSLESCGLLAADPEVIPVPRPTHTLRWRSADNRYIAQLNLPSSSTTDDDAVKRPINVLSVDGEPATELVGEPIVLGTIRGALESPGRTWVTLGELRDACDGRLFVGKDRTEWKLDPVEVV